MQAELILEDIKAEPAGQPPVLALAPRSAPLPARPEASTCNPDEAPRGYRAEPKPAYDPNTGNICRQCDWRKTCQQPETDFRAYGHRCMTYVRADGVSVIFKRRDHIGDANKMVSSPNVRDEPRGK